MIKQGDCLELMKELPDASVDAIICDPPYGSTPAPFDVLVPLEPLWKEFLRVTKKMRRSSSFANSRLLRSLSRVIGKISSTA